VLPRILLTASALVLAVDLHLLLSGAAFRSAAVDVSSIAAITGTAVAAYLRLRTPRSGG
jgi:hypothetical protein